MKIPAKYDRRLFLKGLGAGVGMLPMLESEWVKAAGGAPKPPTRFMSFVVTNGMPVNKFFNTLFMGGGTAPVLSPADLVKMRAARKSLLDVVGRDVDRFCKNLGSDDRVRCGSHLQSFREIENDFTTSTQPGKTVSDVPV